MAPPWRVEANLRHMDDFPVQCHCLPALGEVLLAARICGPMAMAATFAAGVHRLFIPIEYTDRQFYRQRDRHTYTQTYNDIKQKVTAT